jgi:hypothetical protein
MFIGLSAGCVSEQRAVGGGGVGGATAQLVGYSTTGSYPAGVQNVDFIAYCTHNTIPFSLPLGFTNISNGTFNTSNYYAFGWRIAPSALSGPLLTGYADLIVVLRGPASITGGSAAPDSGTWNSLSALTTGSSILALGYSSVTNATIGTGFTTQLAGTGLVLATRDVTEPTTGFTYTGFSNTGTAKICYSLAVK